MESTTDSEKVIKDFEMEDYWDKPSVIMRIITLEIFEQMDEGKRGRKMRIGERWTKKKFDNIQLGLLINLTAKNRNKPHQSDTSDFSESL